jgi:surface antigen
LRAFIAVAALCGVSALAGCSYQLASLASKDDDDVTTGSIPRTAGGTEAAAGPSALDLAYARAAAANVLAHGAKDASVAWENPETGAGGNITPLATPHTEAGRSCRDFLASYVHGGSHDWLEGSGCRNAAGAWEVTRLKPLRSG